MPLNLFYTYSYTLKLYRLLLVKNCIFNTLIIEQSFFLGHVLYYLRKNCNGSAIFIYILFCHKLRGL